MLFVAVVQTRKKTACSQEITCLERTGRDAAPGLGRWRMHWEYWVAPRGPTATDANREEELPSAKHKVPSELKVGGQTTG